MPRIPLPVLLQQEGKIRSASWGGRREPNSAPDLHFGSRKMRPLFKDAGLESLREGIGTLIAEEVYILYSSECTWGTSTDANKGTTPRGEEVLDTPTSEGP